MRRFTYLAAILALIISQRGHAQAPVPALEPGCAGADVSPVVIPLDGTGIADWRFLNPRQPYPLVRQEVRSLTPASPQAFGQCLKDVAVLFDNRTVDRTFEVTLTLTVSPAPAGAIKQSLAELALRSELLKVIKAPTAGKAQAAQAFRQLLSDAARFRPETLNALEVEPLQNALSGLSAQRRAALEAALLLAALAPGEADAALEDALFPKVDLANYKPIDLGEPLRKCLASIKTLENLFTRGQMGGVVRECTEGDDSLEKAVEARQTAVDPKGQKLFWATEPTRALASAARGALQLFDHAASAPSDDQPLREICKEKGTDLTCTSTLLIPPGPTQQLPSVLVERLPKGLVTFSVAFSGEAVIPGNRTGYLATTPKPGEPESSTSWVLSAGVGYSRDPLLPVGVGEDGKPIPLPLTPSAPYAGSQRRHLPGSGEIRLDQTLGNRASGFASLTFKDGDFGASDQSGTVKVGKYQLSLLGEEAVIVKLGKSQVTSSIASNESGEGLEWFYHGVSVGGIVKRESETGVADEANLDHKLYFAQAKNLRPFAKTQSFFSNVDGLFVWGRQEDPEEKPASSRRYWTAGGTLHFVVPSVNVSGDFAIFRSEKEPYGAATTAVRGEGTSALLSLARSQVATAAGNHGELAIKKGATLRTFGVTIAHGDGDDPDTPEIDEGYLGETASFKPDLVFLKSFAGRIADDAGSVVVAPGLSNKWYFGFNYVDRTYSPLFFLKFFAGERKLVASSTEVSYHVYRFVDPVFGSREAGSEVDLKATIEVPKGVTTTLSVGRFFAGAGLTDLFREEPWSVSLSVLLQLKP